MRILAALFLLLASANAAAAQYYEPDRGSDERKAMLDAARIYAEDELGAPVEFLVYELRSDGEVGFANLVAQRPGGGAIDLDATPGAKRGSLVPSEMDGTAMQALMRRSGRKWVSVNWAIGATDVWFSYAPYCRRYSSVIPEFCENDN